MSFQTKRSLHREIPSQITALQGVLVKRESLEVQRCQPQVDPYPVSAMETEPLSSPSATLGTLVGSDSAGLALLVYLTCESVRGLTGNNRILVCIVLLQQFRFGPRTNASKCKILRSWPSPYQLTSLSNLSN